MKAAKLNLLLLAVLVVSTVPLAACTTDPVKIPERVNVPVPVACIPAGDVVEKPQLRAEADFLNMPRGLRTLATWADLLKLHVYTSRLEALVEGCSRLPQ